MGQQVTGTIKLSVQGTGSDKSKVYVTRTGDITDLSTSVHSAKQVIVTTAGFTTINLPEAATAVSCNVIHIRASAPVYAKVRYAIFGAVDKTMIGSHILIKGGRVTSLSIKSLSGTRTVEILLAGRP